MTRKLFLLLLPVIVSFAVETSPATLEVDIQSKLARAGDTAIAVNDTVYSPWFSSLTAYRSGVVSGLFTGSDTVVILIRQAYFTQQTYKTEPDTAILFPWDTLILADTLFRKTLDSASWPVARWVQFAIANIHGSQAVTFKKFELYLVGN